MLVVLGFSSWVIGFIPSVFNHIHFTNAFLNYPSPIQGEHMPHGYSLKKILAGNPPSQRYILKFGNTFASLREKLEPEQTCQQHVNLMHEIVTC